VAVVDELWRPSFPPPALLHVAADLQPSIAEPGGQAEVLGEGLRWEVVSAPA
jgi:hypothetical protein